MENLENNKLIAEFMGMQDTDLGWYDSVEAMSEYACQMVGGGNTFEVLQYDRSWDWLMPVIDKIKILVMEDDSDKLYNSEEWDNITHTLVQIEIKFVYKAVVEFIKQQNKNK